MKTSEVSVEITLQDLKDLSFWASVGLGYANGGTRDQETLLLLRVLNRKYNLKIDKPEIGKWRDKPLRSK